MINRIRELVSDITFNKNENSVNINILDDSSLNINKLNTFDDLENEVSEILKELGIPAHIKGYQFLRDAIIEVTYNNDLINAVTKMLYPIIAEKHKTTPTRVERAIRHAIEVSTSRGKIDTLHKYFGYSTAKTRGKPTNSEFIAVISDKLRLKLKILQKK